MGNEIMQKATEYIESMAEALGVAAEHVYGILVRQQIAEGILMTAIPVLTLLLLGAIAIIFYRKYTKAANDYDSDVDEDIYAFISGTAAIIFVVGFIVSLFIVSDGILKLVNPEYYAIKELLDVIKGGD